MGRSLVRVERNLGRSIRSYTLMRRIIASTLLASALLAVWPAAYQWPPDVDAAVAMAQKTGMRVALALSTAPSWANGGHRSG